jgi:vacuolar protein sorting-associated protein 52
MQWDGSNTDSPPFSSQVLTQLLLYYTRFQEIIKKAWPRKAPAFAKDLVSTTAILVEIRKYNRTF